MQFFSYRSKIPFLGKFCSKNENFQIQLKLGKKTNNSNMQNSIAMFTFSVFDQRHSNRFSTKIQNFHFKVKWRYLLFPIFDRKYPFQGKFKGGVHFFCFRLKIALLGTFGLEKSKLLIDAETW